jgi:hypothetical protein
MAFRIRLGNLGNILQIQNKKLRNRRSQIRNDNKSLSRNTRTQEKLYLKKDEKATNIKVAPATLFPEKDIHRCPQVF